MKLFLLRHGQSLANAGLTEDLDSSLTPLGELQADRTSAHLTTLGVSRVYVSPLLRALQTVAPYCRRARTKARLYPGLCEYFSATYPAYKQFAGMPPSEIQKRFPFVETDPETGCGDEWWPQEFEDDQIIYARAVGVRDSLMARYGQSDSVILIVSHAEVVGRLIEAFLRIPPKPDDPPWSDNCAISLIEADGSEAPARLVYQNNVEHLEG